MKDSDIYLRAAKAVDAVRREFSCIAISTAANCSSRAYDLRNEYEDLFNPENGHNAWGEAWGKKDSTRRQCRVLALLFMSAISKDQTS